MTASDSLYHSWDSLYHSSVKACAEQHLAALPALAPLGAGYAAWPAEEDEARRALVQTLDAAAATLLEFQRSLTDEDLLALGAGQPLPERAPHTMSQTHLLSSAAEYHYARLSRSNSELERAARRLARTLAQAAGYRACPRCRSAHTGSPLAHECADGAA